MEHPYKTELLHNLKTHYNRLDWSVKNNFSNGKDELLFILPKSENIREILEGLYEVLSSLPEIAHPSERVLISFCYEDSSGYCSRVINPNTQDEIHVALLGRLPTLSIRPEDLQQL